MSRVDTAWLRMDNDVNLMMIVGVWLLEPKIAYATLCRRVEDKLLKYERFRQRVVRDAGGPSWVDDDGFDIHRHVVRDKLVRGPGQSEREALQARVGALAMEPLDPARPLWQFLLIENYEGGSALVARIHHCIGDGIALISVMMTITDGGGDPPARKRRAASGEPDDWLAEAVLKPLGGLSAKAAELVDASIARGLDALANPRHLPRRERDQVRVAPHEARPVRVRHDLDDVAGQQHARSVGAGSPQAHRAAGKMAAEAEQPQRIGQLELVA